MRSQLRADQHQICFRLTEEQWATLVRIRVLRGGTITNVFRSAIEVYLQVLEDQTRGVAYFKRETEEGDLIEVPFIG